MRAALRLLCVQDDVAPEMLAMLEGAMRELAVGDPRRLAVDVGPVIDEDARAALATHVARMRAAGLARGRDGRCRRNAHAGHSSCPPSSISAASPDSGISSAKYSGPVLHVLRWRRGELSALVEAINATGYGLTHGIHTRIDETVAAILARIKVGNVYVNRNIVGAVVGVQPFGGHRLSGTGPKAGGPLYLPRLTRDPGDLPHGARGAGSDVRGIELPGPTGETNTWRVAPRGRLVAVGGGDNSETIWRAQADAALAAGNRVIFAPSAAGFIAARHVASGHLYQKPHIDVISPNADWSALTDIDGVLAADPETAAAANRRVAARGTPPAGD